MISFTICLTLTLPSSVTLVAQKPVLDRPTLASLDPRTENQGTIIALEAIYMIVLVKCSYPRCLGLTFLWYNWLFASMTNQREHLVIAFAAIGFILLIECDHFPIKSQSANTAPETVVMKPGVPHHQSSVTVCGNLLATCSTWPCGNQLAVVFFAHDHPIHHANPVKNRLITDAANVTNTSEIFLTDRQILVYQIFIHNLLSAHLTLHAFCMNTRVTKCDVSLGNDLTANCTSGCIVTLGTTWSILFHKELLTQSLFTEFAPET